MRQLSILASPHPRFQRLSLWKLVKNVNLKLLRGLWWTNCCPFCDSQQTLSDFKLFKASSSTSGIHGEKESGHLHLLHLHFPSLLHKPSSFTEGQILHMQQQDFEWQPILISTLTPPSVFFLVLSFSWHSLPVQFHLLSSTRVSWTETKACRPNESLGQWAPSS